MLKELKNRLINFISGEVKTDEERVHLQYEIILEILCTVSFFMVIFNLVTGWEQMAMITLVFAVLFFFNVVIEKKFKKIRRAGRISFIVELILLSLIFVISGEPEGSACIWILLMPSCGFLLFRMTHGLIISTIQFVMLVILMWTPVGEYLNMYAYSSTFKMRFPIVYACFAVVGILFELVRLHSAEEAEKAKEKYRFMCNHDALTGLYNRYGFNVSIDEYCEKRTEGEFALCIMDLDHFKNVNDQYGHVNGDAVLREMAQRIEKIVGESGIVSRWGGEEFSILFTDITKAEEKANKLLNVSRAVPIELEDGKVIVTFSMGVVTVKKDQKVDVGQLIRLADKFLYTAKEVGRNQIIMGEYYNN